MYRMSLQEDVGQIRFLSAPCLAWMKSLLHVMGHLKRSKTSGVYVANAELQTRELVSALGHNISGV